MTTQIHECHPHDTKEQLYDVRLHDVQLHDITPKPVHNDVFVK